MRDCTKMNNNERQMVSANICRMSVNEVNMPSSLLYGLCSWAPTRW